MTLNFEPESVDYPTELQVRFADGVDDPLQLVQVSLPGYFSGDPRKCGQQAFAATIDLGQLQKESILGETEPARISADPALKTRGSSVNTNSSRCCGASPSISASVSPSNKMRAMTDSSGTLKALTNPDLRPRHYWVGF